MARVTNFTFIWLKQPQVASGYHARPGRSGVTGGPDNLQDCTFVNLPGILTDTRVINNRRYYLLLKELRPAKEDRAKPL